MSGVEPARPLTQCQLLSFVQRVRALARLFDNRTLETLTVCGKLRPFWVTSSSNHPFVHAVQRVTFQPAKTVLNKPKKTDRVIASTSIQCAHHAALDRQDAVDGALVFVVTAQVAKSRAFHDVNYLFAQAAMVDGTSSAIRAL